MANFGGGEPRRPAENLQPFGPAHDNGERMMIPTSFEREVEIPGGLRLLVRCEFTGGRLTVPRIELSNDAGLAARDVVSVRLSSTVHSIAAPAVVNPPDTSSRLIGWVSRDPALDNEPRSAPKRRARGGRRPGPDSAKLRDVARIYWFEHVTWGEPRAAVMATFDVSAPTATTWIRRAAETHELPGLWKKKGQELDG